MNSTTNPAYGVEIEDGELTPPSSPPLSSYPEDNVLSFDEEKRQQIETVNLDVGPTTLKSATLIPNLLAYIHSSRERNDIFNLLTKLANNQIQFTFQSGTAVINLQYFQEISTYATQKSANLALSTLEKSFVFQDELEKIFESGKNHAINFANDFIKLNKQVKILSERNHCKVISNLREYIKNISAHIKQAVEKKFPNNSAPNFFHSKQKMPQVNNDAAKESLLNAKQASYEHQSQEAKMQSKCLPCCAIQ